PGEPWGALGKRRAAKEGTKPGLPPGRGAPRGTGSDGRRRRRKGRAGRPSRKRRPTGRKVIRAATAKEGRGRAPAPGAARRGARVHAGSNGESGRGGLSIVLAGVVDGG